jgi:hypothetical protein
MLDPFFSTTEKRVMEKVADSARAHRARAFKSHILAGSFAIAAAGPALAQDDMTALKNQLRVLQERLDKMDARQATAAPPAAEPAAAVTAGDTPGSFKLPGSNTSVTIGGFVKASAILSNRSPGAGSPGDEQLLVGTIPLSSAAFPPGEKDKVKISAKESRLWFRTSTPSRWGPVTTHVEGDFVAATGSEVSTNGYGFRLRHAWGAVGNLGVGQTWSNLLNTSAIPEVIDFGALIGIFGAPRQPGIRWTSSYSNGFWSVALENAETTIAGAAAAPDNDKAPDINAKVNFRTGFGTFEVAGLWRRLAANTEWPLQLHFFRHERDARGHADTRLTTSPPPVPSRRGARRPCARRAATAPEEVDDEDVSRPLSRRERDPPSLRTTSAGAVNQHCLVDLEHVAQPIDHQFLTESRIVVLAMFGAGFFLGREAQRRIHPVAGRILVDFSHLVHAQYVVPAVNDQVGASHFFQHTFQLERLCDLCRLCHRCGAKHPLDMTGESVVLTTSFPAFVNVPYCAV